MMTEKFDRDAKVKKYCNDIFSILINDGFDKDIDDAMFALDVSCLTLAKTIVLIIVMFRKAGVTMEAADVLEKVIDSLRMTANDFINKINNPN